MGASALSISRRVGSYAGARGHALTMLYRSSGTLRALPEIQDAASHALSQKKLRHDAVVGDDYADYDGGDDNNLS